LTNGSGQPFPETPLSGSVQQSPHGLLYLACAAFACVAQLIGLKTYYSIGGFVSSPFENRVGLMTESTKVWPPTGTKTGIAKIRELPRMYADYV
jgi:hypothetical protein